MIIGPCIDVRLSDGATDNFNTIIREVLSVEWFIEMDPVELTDEEDELNFIIRASPSRVRGIVRTLDQLTIEKLAVRNNATGDFITGDRLRVDYLDWNHTAAKVNVPSLPGQVRTLRFKRKYFHNIMWCTRGTRAATEKASEASVPIQVHEIHFALAKNLATPASDVIRSYNMFVTQDGIPYEEREE